MNMKVLRLTVIALLLCSVTLYAGGDERIGSAGAQELRIPVGSRMSALGGAGVAEAIGAEALYWNPAGVAFYDGTEVMFTHLEYFAISMWNTSPPQPRSRTLDLWAYPPRF